MIENVNVPADFAAEQMAMNPTMSVEDLVSAYQAANPVVAPVVTPAETPVVTTETTETTETPVVTQTVETTETTETPTPTFDFSRFGVKDEIELQSKLERYGELEQVYQKYKEVEKDIEVLPMYKNPFADDSILKINNFVKETGIKDVRLASEIMGSTPEQLKADPLQALAIKELLDNPSFAGLGMKKVTDYVAKKYGVDMEQYGQSDYELPVTVELDSIKAISDIESKKEKFANFNNSFVSLQQEYAEQQRLATEWANTWETVTPSISNSLKAISVEMNSGLEGVGAVKFSVAVSDAELKQATDLMKSVFKGYEPTSENQAAMRQAIEERLWLTKRSEILGEYAKQIHGKTYKAVVQEKHNLAPVTETPANPNVAPKRELDAAEQFLATLGK